MMTTATRPVVHETWCNDHAAPDPRAPGDTGFCDHSVTIGGEGGPMVEVAATPTGPEILLWARNFTNTITPAEARQVAAALIDATELVEGPVDPRDQYRALVVRNLAALMAAQDEITVHQVGQVANVFGVDGLNLLRTDYDPRA